QAATKAQATTTINVLAQNQSECLKAIGNAYFCNCIAQAIPVGLDFIGYVRFCPGPRAFNTLSAADKTLVDAPRQGRDKCVNLAGKNATTAPATSGIALPQFNPQFTPLHSNRWHDTDCSGRARTDRCATCGTTPTRPTHA